MVTEEGVVVTESDWIAAQSRARRLGWVCTHGGLVVGIGLCLLAVLVGDAVEPAGARWLVTAGLMYLLLLPFAVGSLLTARKQQGHVPAGFVSDFGECRNSVAFLRLMPEAA